MQLHCDCHLAKGMSGAGGRAQGPHWQPLDGPSGGGHGRFLEGSCLFVDRGWDVKAEEQS